MSRMTRRSRLSCVVALAVLAGVLMVLPAGAAPPPPLALGVAVGDEYTCALKADNAVVCWGDVVGSPSGTFTQISGGLELACGVKPDTTVACWGLVSYGVSLSGTFKQVDVGGAFACGVRTDKTLACSGPDNTYGELSPPLGTFSQVSAGGYHACARKTTGGVLCWGDNSAGQSSPPPGVFNQVSAGFGHSCGVKPGGTVICWGANGDGESTPPPDTFTQVSAGVGYTCGVKTDATVACWGFTATPPSGAFKEVFTDVESDFPHTCGLTTGGMVVCWGDNSYDELGVAPLIAGSPPVAFVDHPYDFQFTDGALPAATYQLVQGGIDPHPLPPGLSLSGSGEIAGTPTAVGTWKVTVKATNVLGSNSVHASIAVQGVDLVNNGGFETPVVGKSGILEFRAEQTMGRWTVTAGSVDIVNKVFWVPQKQKQSLDLNGVNPGSIEQIINLPRSANYQISFALAGNPDCGDPVKQFQVWWNGIAVLDGQFDTTEHTHESLGWTNTTVNVSGEAGPATLAFTSSTDGGCGATLDSVMVKQLP